VYHVYPDEGVATLCHALADDLDDAVELEAPVEKIYVEDGRAVGVRVAGGDVEASAVVTTAPISILPRLVEGTDALAPFAQFKFRGMAMVNLKLRGSHLLRDTIVWLPKGYPFFRLTEATQSMPWLAPAGMTMVLAEIGADPGDPTWTADDGVLIETVLSSLEPLVPELRTRLIGTTVLRQPLSYPVFLTRYEESRMRLEREGTGVRDLLSVGRNGEFQHILMEDIYWRTMRMLDRWMASRVT
jgi:protoporphyrinogen oxidase